MTGSVPRRQHAVSRAADTSDPSAPVRPKRTPAGDALTDLILSVTGLAAQFTAVGEALARPAGQTLARWVVLDLIEDAPATVAQIARRRGFARQSVQRLADLLVRDGLAAYEPNPRHQRAKLLRPTPAGREALRRISIDQKAWSDALGAAIGTADLRQAKRIIDRVNLELARSSPSVRARDVEWEADPTSG